ncbi:hypothetical protein B0H67DRAFT_561276 [Lasiosphaeris hirsuta]|uniref:Uncharacterized protein n=1 Tax=Lasiosphaeris hirsuta TaxID=260670 RepID=A0AA40B9W6_9PEZI|nr:hypothetical protein B0H67DRAFT_561276 [Lasiosphaeris hirsuta]
MGARLTGDFECPPLHFALHLFFLLPSSGTLPCAVPIPSPSRRRPQHQFTAAGLFSPFLFYYRARRHLARWEFEVRAEIEIVTRPNRFAPRKNIVTSGVRYIFPLSTSTT